MRLRLVRSASIIALAAVVLFTARAEAQESGRWDLLLDLPNGDVQHLIFATDDTAWAAAAGAIFRSPDAGRTWEIASLTRSFMSDLEAAPGGQHGWAVGTLGQLYLTEDGGATWVESDPGTEVNISHVEALSEDVVLIAGTGIGLSDVPVFPETSSFRRSTDGAVS